MKNSFSSLDKLVLRHFLWYGRIAFVRVPQMTLWTNAIRPYITNFTKIVRESINFTNLAQKF
jgi:hypothetical protein